MLKEIFTLIFVLVLIHSNAQSETIKEAKQIKPIEEKVVQTVKVEKQKEVKKAKTKQKWKIYNVTAFTNGYESTQKHKGQKGYGIQANGERTVEGKSIACPKSLEFGTKVKIKELNNTYVCSDRGSRITEGHLDIFFEDLEMALDFGRQNLHVQIIKKEVD